jgi:penicillin-binding protein-related factor A (putative recombinase)
MHILNRQNIQSYILVYFIKYDKYFWLDFNFINNNKTKIEYEIIKSSCKESNIVYPGILNFDKTIL